jgi:hypothetical protein
MVEDVGLVRGKNVVAVIDFRQTTIYPTDASHYWVAYAEHRRDVAAKVVADVRAGPPGDQPQSVDQDNRVGLRCHVGVLASALVLKRISQ